MTADHLVMWAPVAGPWLRLLCEGWGFSGAVLPSADHHGAFSVLLWREATDA